MPRSRITEVAAIGHRQHGLVTTQQLSAAGVPERTVRDWRARGRLTTVEPRVMRVAGAPVTWHGMQLAACLSADGMASHQAAAVLHALPGFRPSRRVVTIPWNRRWSGGAEVHRSRHFEEIAVVRIAGIPTVGVAQLIVDLAALAGRRLAPTRVEDALDHLLRVGAVTFDELEEIARVTRGRRSPGSAVIRTVVTDYDPAAESALEQDHVRVLGRAGLPRPTPQHEVFDADGTFIARVDGAYVDLKIAMEVDSLAYHLNRRAFEDDRSKRNRLRAAGWLVLEHTSRMIRRRPDLLVADVRQAIALRNSDVGMRPAS